MAKIFYKDRPIIGLDISTTSVKVMAIDPKKWLVLGYGSLDLEPSKIKESLEEDSTYLEDNIKLLLKEKVIGSLPSNHVAVSIPTARSFSRTFTLPAKISSSLHDAVELEAEQYIPIPVNTLYIDYEVIDRNKTELTILMTAVARSIIDKCIAAIENAGLVVSLVEPSISSVARLLTHTEDGHLPSIIVDIGPASTDIAVLDKKRIQVTGGSSIGGNSFTISIAKHLNVTLENAHQLKVLNGLSAGSRQEKIRAALDPQLKSILTETRRVMRYYSERVSSAQELQQLLIVGGGSNLPGIGEYFTNELMMPARVASPWQKLDFGRLDEPGKQFRPRYIAVAGLASVNPGGIWK
jgi:type IV pilus assembly protein PilM